MFDKFTDNARRIIQLAQEEARMLNHGYVDTEHFLLEIDQFYQYGDIENIFIEFIIALEDVRFKIEEVIGEEKHKPSGHIPFAPRSNKMWQTSLQFAIDLEHDYIDIEHVLLATLQENESIGYFILVGLEVNIEELF